MCNYTPTWLWDYINWEQLVLTRGKGGVGGSGWGGSKEQGGVDWRGKPQTCHRKISPQTGVTKLSVNVIMAPFSVRAKLPFPPNTLSAMATILLSYFALTCLRSKPSTFQGKYQIVAISLLWTAESLPDRTVKLMTCTSLSPRHKYVAKASA